MFALFLAACGGEPPPEPTTDTRVDHAGKDDTFNAQAPRMCIAEDGHVYAVWQEARGGAEAVWFGGSPNGGESWGAGDAQVNHDEAATSAPDLACDNLTVWVVWEDERDGELLNHNIYLNRSDDGGSLWLEEDIRLDADIEGEAMSLAPRIVADGDNVYVVWFDNRDGAFDIYLQASHDRGDTWFEAPRRVDTDGPGEAYSAWPRLVAGGDDIGVVWEDTRNGSTDIYFNRSDDGGDSFAADDQRVDGGDEPGAAHSFAPAIARDGEDVFVVWHDERSGARRDVYVNWSAESGASFQSEALRADSDAEGMSDAINADVAADKGRAQVVWQDDRSGGYDIYQRVLDDGAWKWDELRIDTDIAGEGQSYHPRVTAVEENVLVVWQDYRADSEGVGFNDLIYNWSTNRGAQWNAYDMRINSNKAGSSYAIDHAVGLLGNHFAVLWADGRFGTGDVFYASRELGVESVYIEPEEKE